MISVFFFFFNDTATTEIYTLSLHDALPIFSAHLEGVEVRLQGDRVLLNGRDVTAAIRTARISGLTSRLTRHAIRSEEHTSELQSRLHLVCRLLLEKKKKKQKPTRARQTSER